MTAESEQPAPLATPEPLSGVVRHKLEQAACPLKLAEVVKGLPRPKGLKPADFQRAVVSALDAEYDLGRVFRYPSGAKEIERFWARDEKQVLRDAAVKAAAEPKTLAAMRTALGKVIKGTSPNFIDDVVRGLIGEDRLFEHPPKTKAGGPLFAAFAPPPPLPPIERPKFRKKLETLAKSVVKLLTEAESTLDDLVTALRPLLSPPTPAPDLQPAHPASPGAQAELDRLILQGVANAGPGSVVSLLELRREMPADFRGRVFDAAVLRLADAHQLRVYQDADPLRFSPDERAEYVSDDAGHVFTSIAKRG